MTRLDEMEQDVFVEIIDFKDNPAEELVTQNADGSYTVFVNARIAWERQQEAIAHAMRHINNFDFEKDNVQQIEAEAHQIVDTPISKTKKARKPWTPDNSIRSLEKKVFMYMSKIRQIDVFEDGWEEKHLRYKKKLHEYQRKLDRAKGVNPFDEFAKYGIGWKGE